ncbi:hypothetical protein Nham_2669 [Nitrobacter hamburgensis X14]|uniref:Uncharacterized protein n=1 Tax=Nitrobacter hamburgensis (strain DSM 10229 / NCIMB 13809 / X14) TaxID=323097 RepID=Q1QJZ9_NITHX|nr:hypothetical protein Nham_2669 [Nitrobacter hamburgensis X14]
MPPRKEPVAYLHVHYMFYIKPEDHNESTGFSRVIFSHDPNGIDETPVKHRHCPEISLANRTCAATRRINDHISRSTTTGGNGHR